MSIINNKRKNILVFGDNGKNKFLFVNATKIFQLKTKSSEIESYPLCLENILKILQSLT